MTRQAGAARVDHRFASRCDCHSRQRKQTKKDSLAPSQILVRDNYMISVLSPHNTNAFSFDQTGPGPSCNDLDHDLGP
jgi:hypothetical protein